MATLQTKENKMKTVKENKRIHLQGLTQNDIGFLCSMLDWSIVHPGNHTERSVVWMKKLLNDINNADYGTKGIDYANGEMYDKSRT